MEISGKAVICSAQRTPFGKFGGSLRNISAVELGAAMLNTVLRNLPGLNKQDIDEVILGHVLPGSGLSPARQAVLAAGFPVTTNALTLDRACCSALTAIGIGFQHLAAGQSKYVVAGGMENMSQTPYLIPQMRWGQRLGDFTVRDELVIRNPYVNAPMAQYAGETALENDVDRAEQDEWSLRSHKLWDAAQKAGKFEAELISVNFLEKGKENSLTKDEHPRPDTSLDKLAQLPTVYGSLTVTAGNASGLADGAAAVVLTDYKTAEQQAFPKLASIIGYTAICGEPRNSTSLPGLAIRKILREVGLTLDDISVIEINEAFAAMPLVSSLLLTDFDRSKTTELRKRINPNGGAVAIGHPLGATGARLLMNAVYELRRRGGGYGVIAICGAIGQADAVLVRVD